METASLGFAIAGAVELVKHLFDKDFRPAAIIVVAAVMGAILSSQIGATWFQGMLLGLQASGMITVASYISK